ncbi:MAG: hypothetical protein WB586_13790, partial [Chthoniobacterales bacterium]
MKPMMTQANPIALRKSQLAERWFSLGGDFNVFPAKETLDHFVVVRIHARQPSSPRADSRAINDPTELNKEIAVIWLLSCFAVLLMPFSSTCADNGAHLRLLS